MLSVPVMILSLFTWCPPPLNLLASGVFSVFVVLFVLRFVRFIKSVIPFL